MAALAAALVLLPACTSDDDGTRRLDATFSGGEDEGPPSAQPSGACPAGSADAAAAVYGTSLTGVAFVRPDGGGLIGPDGRALAGREPVTRHGAQVKIAGNAHDFASLGRHLVVLYDSGRLFAIDTTTCAESARYDLTSADIGVPAKTEFLFDGFARSAGPTTRTVVYGRFSPPGQKDYEGFAVEIGTGLSPGRAERYGKALVVDVWVDALGEPLVLLNDGSVREVGQAAPVVAATYDHATDAASVSRGSDGVWISGGRERANYVRRPNGQVLSLPSGSFAYPIVARGRDAVVLLRSRAEAWIVGPSGRRVVVPVGDRPADALTVGDGVLVIGKDSSDAVLIAWASREVVGQYSVGPSPARLVPLG